MRKHDDILGDLNKDSILDLRARVEKRMQAKIKEALERPEVQQRIETEIEEKVEAIISKGVDQRIVDWWASHLIDEADYEDEVKVRNMINLLKAVFLGKANRDKLLRKYDIKHGLCLRCSRELYGGTELP